MATISKNIPFNAKLRNVALHVCKTKEATSLTPQDQAPIAAEVESDPVPDAVAGSHLQECFEGVIAQLESLENARVQSHAELQSLAIELSMIIASHVVKRELDADTLNLTETVSAAIEQLLPAHDMTIRVNPDDALDLERLELSFSSELTNGMRLVQDDSMPRGGCLVASEESGLLTTLEARLENIRDTLLQGIEYARIERRKTDGIGDALRRFPDRRKPA